MSPSLIPLRFSLEQLYHLCLCPVFPGQLWLTQEEHDKLLSFCENWLQELVTFALHTGMRMAEMLNLKWKNVDLNKGTVTILESKNGQIRTLPLNETMMRELQRINRECKVANIEGYIFTKDGFPISKQQLRIILERL